MDNAPIFIVGVPRSGTTLLAALIGSHSNISCGPETQFFSNLLRNTSKTRNGSSGRDFSKNWPDSGLSFLNSIHHVRASVVDNYGINADQLTRYLRSREPSIATVAAALPDIFRDQSGKRRWAEKTPDHLPHVGLIRACFPHSPIIRIVRDPRDVALSLVKVPWGPRSLLEAIDLWMKYDRLSKPFFATDERSFTVRYEDLLADPVSILSQICSYVGEGYQESMLDTKSAAREVNRADEPWKAAVGEPIKNDRLAIWKQELGDDENRTIESLLGDRLRAFDYECRNDFSRFCELVTPIEKVLLSDLSALSTEGFRFWSKSAAERPELQLLLGDPDESEWFSGNTVGRGHSALKLFARVVQSRINRIPVKWYRRPSVLKTSKCGFSLSAMLSIAGVRSVEPYWPISAKSEYAPLAKAQLN